MRPHRIFPDVYAASCIAYSTSMYASERKHTRKFAGISNMQLCTCATIYTYYSIWFRPGRICMCSTYKTKIVTRNAHDDVVVVVVVVVAGSDRHCASAGKCRFRFFCFCTADGMGRARFHGYVFNAPSGTCECSAELFRRNLTY